MFVVRSSYRGFTNPWDSFRIVFFIIIMGSVSGSTVKKAIVDWSPNASPFVDPMIDHTAMVELQLMDRIVFACDQSVPAIIYKVSEESFADCKYDTSAEWIGQCSEGVRYITVFLHSTGDTPGQPTFLPNTTHFFASFSSGSRRGLRSRRGDLCMMGVRLILEVRDSNARVPMLPSSSLWEERKVPVQRVSYGGRPTAKPGEMGKSLVDDFSSESQDFDTDLTLSGEEMAENKLLFTWPWMDSSVPRELFDKAPRVKKREPKSTEVKRETPRRDYFNYFSAGVGPSWLAAVIVPILLLGI